MELIKVEKFGIYIFMVFISLFFYSCIPSYIISSKVSTDTYTDVIKINNIILSNESKWFSPTEYPAGIVMFAKNDKFRFISSYSIGFLKQFLDSSEVFTLKEIFQKGNIKNVFIRDNNTIFYILKESKSIPFVTSFNEVLFIEYCVKTNIRDCPDYYPFCDYRLKVKSEFYTNFYLIKAKKHFSWKFI